ncbi:MAG: 16S rRNA (adenine(1518)-N(6)/adenine(1519)-N(6))-dimethyltransferase RsmA [Bacteroidia bacterium]|nr:16S rRNA (adenine(1518)-N(6)/adenine(1519)-N(6))-dimethyltransferase RsmA [Bacteroidia bacterium]
MQVRAKKNLGQHFLTDKNIARDIVDSLKATNLSRILEIGPGMGVLTNFLLENKNYETFVIEIDHESVEYLHKHFPQLKDRIIEGDFLQLDLESQISDQPFALIGNLPYNISSQIFFKVLENKELIPEVVCMLQKEVAKRICSGPGSKVYGILSVFLQAWYNIEYLIDVPEYVFDPPPKVQSAVIRLTANGRTDLGCNETLFRKVVKQAFNQRRKMLRNSIKSFSSRIEELDAMLLTRRPEQLSVAEFIDLTNSIEKLLNN